MRTQGTYSYRGTEGGEGRTEGRTEGQTEGRADGRTEGRKAKNYVPPLFFEKAGDKNMYLSADVTAKMSNATYIILFCHLLSTQIRACACMLSS